MVADSLKLARARRNKMVRGKGKATTVTSRTNLEQTTNTTQTHNSPVKKSSDPHEVTPKIESVERLTLNDIEVMDDEDLDTSPFSTPPQSPLRANNDDESNWETMDDSTDEEDSRR